MGIFVPISYPCTEDLFVFYRVKKLHTPISKLSSSWIITWMLQCSVVVMVSRRPRWTITAWISIVKPTRCASVSNYFILEWHTTCFGRSFRPSSGEQASKQTAVSVWHTPVAVCTVLISWWWTERPSETCRVSFQNKIIWYNGASSWFCYRNILRCTALWTSKIQLECVTKILVSF